MREFDYTVYWTTAEAAPDATFSVSYVPAGWHRGMERICEDWWNKLNKEATMTELDRQIAVMEGYRSGKKIEVRQRILYGEAPWHNAPAPEWDWANREYRIKSEPVYAPLTKDDLPDACWVRSKGNLFEFLITYKDTAKVEFNRTYATYRALEEDYEYRVNGEWKPCRKVVG